MSREALSNIDAAWLRMDTPHNRMIITGFFEFADVLDLDRARDVLQHRLVDRHERFAQRVVESRFPLQGPAWETDPEFDLDHHLGRVTVPAPGDDAALRRLIDDLAGRPLDPDRPLWHFDLIEGLGGRSILFVRLHHAIGDGIALTRLLLSLCDEAPDRDAVGSTGSPGDVDVDAGDGDGLFGSVVAGARHAAMAGLQVLRHPGVLREATAVAGGLGKALNRLVTMYPDNRTVLKGTLTGHKRTAWIDPIPLEAVKAVGRATGATVNDVLVAVASGAIGRYLDERQDARRVDRIRAMVPFNLRSLEEDPPLGNGFGLVILGLPVGTEDPVERLAAVRAEMRALKDSPEAVLVLGILRFTGMSPIQVQNTIVRFFGTKTSIVLTNVPGPTRPLHLAGSRIATPMFWVPQSGGMGVGMSILSYAGGVHVGIIADGALVPDPDRISTNFVEGFAELQAAVVATAERGRCAALTLAGARCRNRPLPGSDRCRVHSAG